jgi:hypothetical protein
MNNSYSDIKRTHIKDFEPSQSILEGSSWLVVVKSQDQTLRRNRLLSGLKNGKYGRTETRPTATGLLAYVTLSDGLVRLNWKREFQEPRHIIQLDAEEYALTDVNGVNIVSKDGSVKRRILDPLYAFLHSIDRNESDRDKLLICSSGYDAVIESNLITGERSFLWSAWENGFNPDEEGNWLALTTDYYNKLLSDGKQAIFVDPAKYGEQGINTKYRSAHPNVAVYNPYKNNEFIIVSIGHGGTLYEVDLVSLESRLIFNGLSQMPHGLMPYENGWVVTNTTKGEIWFLTSDFTPTDILSFDGFPGKMAELGAVEWLQNTKLATNGTFLCLDANRGLVAFDLLNRRFNVFQPDPEWCFQDAIVV